MRRFWRNLPFFWKVYTGAVALICIVVLLAEFAEDFIPYMVNKRESNLIVLEEWLDRYEQANPAGRKELRAAMRGQGVWFIELPPGVHESQAAQLAAGDLPRRPILDLLPESDDWEHDWTVVDRKLPSGELLAAGIPEPQYFDALEGVMWFAVIALFAGVCCYFFSLFITSRLSRIVNAAESLSGGDLAARVPGVAPEGDEIARLARSFNSMAGNIERAIENERRLLYDISHELRSPLARMRLALDLAVRAPSGQAGRYLSVLDADIGRMSTMVEEVIEQGRSEAVLEELSEELEVAELLRGVAETASFEFSAGRSKAGCLFNCRLDSPVRLRGKRILLEQAVYNVLSNGMRYSPPGSAVEMTASLRTVERPGDNDASAWELLVDIRDYGPGVPDASLDKLFKPFYRVESARDKLSGGSGLGLALAYNYVKRHNGGIIARNARPGLLVSITLPVAGAEARGSVS